MRVFELREYEIIDSDIDARRDMKSGEMEEMKLRVSMTTVGLSMMLVIALGGWMFVVPAGAVKISGPGLSPATVATPKSNHSAKSTAYTKSSTTVLEHGTIVGHRFVKSFSLSKGALTLTPFRGVSPTLSSAAETTLWATQGIGGIIEGVGFADVTVTRSTTKVVAGPAVSTLDNTPSLVGLTKNDGSHSCPALRPGEGTSFIPVSQGWYAVIFPLDLNKSDVVFSAAYEALSVDWHLETHATTGMVIVASVPRCGHITTWGGGGNEYTHQFEYQVEAAVLDRVVGTTCSPATNVDEGPNYASPSTTHGYTGPVLSAGPHAGDVMTPKGPKAQPLV
jgi:hypothetical protein